MPLEWDEVADCDPAAFTLAKAPARFVERGDASAGIDSAVGSLDTLLELSASQEAAGLGDAPWPPHYKKQRDPPHKVPADTRAGVEIDAQLVGMLEVVGAHRVRVQVDAPEVHHP